MLQDKVLLIFPSWLELALLHPYVANSNMQPDLAELIILGVQRAKLSTLCWEFCFMVSKSDITSEGVEQKKKEMSLDWQMKQILSMHGSFHSFVGKTISFNNDTRQLFEGQPQMTC